MKVDQVDVSVRTFTKDKVAVMISTAVQVAVDPQNIEDFAFKLADPHRQVHAMVESTLRSTVPQLTLDEAFTCKETMAAEVKQAVTATMGKYGIVVHKALITEVLPDHMVLEAMNEINRAARQRAATFEQAEAMRTMLVKKAEAEAQAKFLSGQGLSKQRTAITEGYEEGAVDMYFESGMDPVDSVCMMVATQYMDVVQDFAKHGNPSLIIPFSHLPNMGSDVAVNSMTDALESPTKRPSRVVKRMQRQPREEVPLAGIRQEEESDWCQGDWSSSRQHLAGSGTTTNRASREPDFAITEKSPITPHPSVVTNVRPVEPQQILKTMKSLPAGATSSVGYSRMEDDPGPERQTPGLLRSLSHRLMGRVPPKSQTAEYGVLHEDDEDQDDL
eukprot:CAMPEP_0184327028 /NCGR_PEP_ID=MMETSP1049-20130417/142878_1 /TAXON_ID=77928 /ORGANISM="Proteomonas sulcata, Strain CCMP704" /LENGTH=387 /DNA_ID=CAMNT_0026649261 /DNA_START=268 /DNA_END=1431 /DNA_ORIENTATION=-